MTRWLTALLLAAASPIALAGDAGRCEALSGAHATIVVELYTSEGCNSCPPADRWLSTLKGRPDVVALAYHVDYWDRLGWVDRFASPAFTERQYARRAATGARFVYTPQVVADGADWRRWPRALPPQRPSQVDLALRRDGDIVQATVTPRAGAPAALAAYWAVVEDGHVTAVKAGENDGVTLHHDHVVQQYEAVAAWRDGERTLRFTAPAAPNRRVVLVVEDAQRLQPLQALALGC